MLAYICLSFSIQTILLSGRLARRELHSNLSLPRTLAPNNWIKHTPSSHLILDVQLPNIFFGIQVFWELKLHDAQTGKNIRLRYQLYSGHNHIEFPLKYAEPRTLAQFQRGFYQAAHQSFYIRDYLGTLHMRYRIEQDLKLAILSATSLLEHRSELPAHTSQDPLSSHVHQLAQEGLGEQRPYYPGDDPRRINWKLYSRFNELYVRVPEEQQIFSHDLHCYFVPDMACYPKFLRNDVLDHAGTYFWGKLKELHKKGYRILAYIPGETQGILYEEASEERILHLLAAYPRNAALPTAELDASLDSQTQTIMTQLLVASHTRENTSKLVFTSPHSISHSDGALLEYFPANQTRYIPLPEPSAALHTDLLKKNPAFLLPLTLLWHWLLQGSERLKEESKALQIYYKLGLPIAQENSVVAENIHYTHRKGKMRKKMRSHQYKKNKVRVHQPLQAQRYPQLLLWLWAWKLYYRQPERRYAVRNSKNSTKEEI